MVNWAKKSKFIGTNQPDYFDGSHRSEIYFGLAGNDTILGNDGNDHLFGGKGADHIEGGRGNDFLDGGKGRDTLLGGEGHDRLLGGTGADVLDGGSGNDALFGGRGADEIEGGTGNDLLVGGRGRDTLSGGAGHDRLFGGQGKDTLLGGEGNDILFGDGPSAGCGWWPHWQPGYADFLNGGAGRDIVFAGGGNDEVFHNVEENQGYQDYYWGGRGFDTLTLDLTQDEWFQADLQTDLAQFLQFIADNTKPNGETNNNAFRFTAFDLKVRGFENVRILVDGQELDPADQPVTAVDDTAGLNEDDGATLFGSVLGNDDVPDLAKAVRLISGPAEGILIFNEGAIGAPDGSFSFNPAGDFDDLADGETRQVTFVYEVEDADGDTDQATVTITVTGVGVGGGNTPPTVVADMDTATDDGVAATGNVLSNDSDVDAGDVLSVANPGVYIGTYGTLTLLADGSYSYVVTDESIDDGFSDDDIFAVQVSDGTAVVPTTLTLAITGQNDAPTVVADVDTATDDGVAATGNVLSNDSDVDAGDVLSVANPGVYIGTYGTLTLLADGSYSYVVTDESIDDGFSDDDIFAVQVSDGTAVVPTTLTLAVTGQNDAPTVVADVDTATDDGVAATGNVLTNDSDVDAGDVLSVANPGVYIGTYGTLTLLADGSYSYVVTDESIDDGFSDDDIFAVQVSDGTAVVPTTLTLAVTGQNDAPTVVADVDTATDDGVAATGNVLSNDSDVDAGDVLSVANPGVYIGTYGTLTLLADGSYSYVVTDESIDDGFSDDDIFAVQVSDGTAVVPTTLTLAVTGQNDAPTVVADVDTATDDGVAATGNVLTNDSDVDAGDVLSVANPGVYIGTYGTLTLLADGSYSYVVTDESIDDGFSDDDIFAVQVSDGTAVVPTTLTLAVTGQNDAPTVVADVDTATDDGVAATGNVLSNDSDVDAGDVLSVANPGVYIGTYGTLTLLADGSYSYVVTDESIDDGFSDDDIFAVQVSDGTAVVPTTLTLAVTGQNDAPTVVADVDTATDDGVAATGNVLSNDSDVDAGDVLSVANPGVYIGTYGTLTLLADGSYSYVVTDESIDDGFSDDDIFAVQVSDGTAVVPTTLTLAVTGQNDAPTVVADVDTATDDGVAATGNVLTNDSDVDAGDVLSVANPGVYIGTYGTLTLLADGSYSYVVTDESIDDGFSDDDIFAVQVSDGTAVVPTTLTLAVTGQNDAPTVVADTFTSPAAGTAVGNVLANDSDEDAADTLVVSEAGGFAPGTLLTVTSVGGRTGLATVQANGDIFFDPDGKFDDLTGTQTDTVIIAYLASDGTAATGGTITITVTGANNAPTAFNDTASTDEDTAVTIAVLDNDTDPETDPLNVTMVDGQAISVGGTVTLGGSGAEVTLNADGTLDYDPGGAFDALAAGAPGADSFTYTIEDTGGLSSTATVDVTLVGVNDAPVAGNALLGVSENVGLTNGAPGTGSFFATASDVDGTVDAVVSVDGQTDGITGVVGLYGTLTWNATTGAYEYQVNDSDPAIHGLLLGQSLNETFDFIVQDNSGANSNIATLTVTINGVKDGVFTEQADLVTLASVVVTYPQTAFDGNFLDALGGDDTVSLLSGAEASTYLAQFAGQTFMAGAGNDTITVLNDFMNTDGGSGSDTLDLSMLLGVTGPVRYELAVGDVDISKNLTVDLTATNFENVIGTALADELVSSAADNGIFAGDGNDRITVLAGTTSLGDTYVGGDGSADELRNASGSNLVFAAFDYDGPGTVNGSGIENVYMGGVSINGTNDGNLFDFNGVRFWEISTTLTDVEVSTGGGDDTVMGSSISGVTTLGGGTFRMDYDLGAGNDSFTGMGGNTDVVLGGLGDDTIDGGGGNDTLEGGAGADILRGGIGADNLLIRLGDQSELDTLDGGDGTDNFFNLTGGDFAFSGFDFDGGATANGNSVENVYLGGVTMLGTGVGNLFDFDGARFYQVSTTASDLEVSTGAGNDTVFGSATSAVTTLGGGTFRVDYDLGAGNDSFTGVGGNTDVVLGQDGDDTIDGGAGNDTLNGGADNDTLRGNSGLDVLDGGTGVDLVEGGEGNDTIGLSAGSAHEIEFYVGGAGTDRVVNNTGGNVTLNLINATIGALFNVTEIEEFDLDGETLLGTGGGNIFDLDGVRFYGISTTLTDVEVSTGGGDDTVMGSSISGVTTLGGGTFRMDYDLGAGNDSFTGMGGNMDVVLGGLGDDTIDGGGGNDTLEGGAGADILRGGIGTDNLLIRLGDQSELDTLDGGDGTDNFFNLTGGDFAFSGFDFDGGATANGNSVENVYLGGVTMLGTGVGNLFDFDGARFYQVSTTASDLEVSTGAGNDTVFGSATSAVTTLGGGTFRVDYDLGAGNDSFTGVGGNTDVVLGQDGNDTIDGGAGNDTLNGGADNDTLRGNSGLDVLDGGTGVDLVEGGEGNDTIGLSAGSAHEIEFYVGGAGTDRVVNNTGGNVTLNLINATIGALFNVTEIEEFDLDGETLLGTGGGNIFDLDGVRFYGISTTLTDVEVSTGGGDDTVMGSSISGVTTLGGGTFRMDYDLGAGNDSFTGMGGNMDVVLGGLGDDTIDGGGGNDTLEGGAGADILRGGIGTDNLLIRLGDQSELDTLDGGDGTDNFFNLTGGDFAFSGFDFDGGATANGNSVENVYLGGVTMLGTGVGNLFDFDGARFYQVSTTASDLEVSTGAGNDTVFGSATSAVTTLGGGTFRVDYDLGAGNDSFTGVGGNTDVVLGQDGNDTIDGGAGNDTLNGGADNDDLTGALGNDTFVFGAGSGLDTVQDFQIGSDKIDLTALGTDWLTLAPFVTDDGTDTTIDLDGTALNVDEIVLLNVIGIGASDFLL